MEADNQAFLYENLPVFLSCSFLRKPNSSRKSRGGGGERESKAEPAGNGTETQTRQEILHECTTSCKLENGIV